MSESAELTTSDAHARMARVTDRLLEPVVIINPDSSLRYANIVAASYFDAPPEALVGRKLLNFVHPDDRARVARELSTIVDHERAAGYTQFRVRGNSSQPWYVMDCYAHDLSDEPGVNGILVSGTDVTDRENLARALQTLSECNDVLVHATDEASLIRSICRAIVRSSAYMLAWVGYVERDADQTVRFVDAHGATEFLADLSVSWGDNEFGRGATGQAIRTGTTQVITDTLRSQRCTAWHERIEEQCVRTACSLPLIVNNTVIGALTIYSLEYGTFSDAEVELLGKLAKNLSYGIGRIRDAKLLADKESHLREAEHLAQMGHWEWVLRTDDFAFLSDEMFTIMGIKPHEWFGSYDDFLATIDASDRASVEAAFSEVITSGSSELIYKVHRRDQQSRWVRMHAETKYDDNGLPDRVVGVTLDITSYVTAKQDLAHSRQFLLAITDNMTEGMIATDTEGVITFANAAAGRLLARDAADLIGAEALDVFQIRRENDVPAEARGQLRAVWTEGTSLYVDHEALARRDGTMIPVSFNATPLRDDGLRGSVVVFEDITERVSAQLKIERELEKLSWVGRVRDALDVGSFVLYAQPIIDLASRQVLQHELLIRLVNADGEVIAPDNFLPAAEEFGLITEIDRWVVNETAKLAAQGHAVEFNVSAKSIADPGMLAHIAAALATHQAPASNIVCEITETALVRDLVGAEEFVRGLNDLGIQVALDDFGAGYGGFAYLKRLPVAYLKIDREFVSDLIYEVSSQHVVSAVVNLAKAFGMKTIAEGAENEKTLHLLEELGVDHVQGFVVGRPENVTDTFGSQD